MSEHAPNRLSRRRLLIAGTAGAALAGCSPKADEPAQTTTTPAAQRVSPYGKEQSGVARPQPPQRNLQLSVWDTGAGVANLLADLGELGAALMTHEHDALREFEPARLTVTIGVGPSVVHTVDGKLPGAEELPRFAREDYAKRQWQGDVAVQTCADDPALQAAAVAVLNTTLRKHATLRWAQNGARGEARSDGSSRNLLGFVDGTIGPRSASELAENVWLDGPAQVNRGTIMVARRMRVDATSFLAKDVRRQERIIGRRRGSGGPLPGSREIKAKGRIGDELDLDAKTADGQYVVPAGAHARRAHPKFTGSHVMLRRSYSYDNGPDDTGLLFISFQQALRTFVTTQQRLDDQDDLMEFTTTTASGTFLVLPGFSERASLGGQLFAR